MVKDLDLDIKILLSLYKCKKLAKFWCVFNRWNWPKDYPDKKPLWWVKEDGCNHAEVHKKKFDFIRPIQEFIENKIGLGNCLLEWNKDI